MLRLRSLKEIAIEYALVKEHHLPVKVTETALAGEVKDRSSSSATISQVPAGTKVSLHLEDWKFEEGEKPAKSNESSSGK